MNPRFWGAVNLAVKNGYNFPLGLITLAENGVISAGSVSPRAKPVRSLWIVGELIAGLDEFKKGKAAAPIRSLARILFPGKNTSYDDFRWSDPLPFAAELVYYGSHFLKSGFSINPVDEEMIG